MMTKKDDRNWLLSTRPCHIWLGFKWEGKDFYLSWHYRGGLQRCPLKSQCSFCALQQPKCFKAIPCCTICTPTPVERKEKKVFKAACSALCWEKERAFYEGQSLQNVCWRAKRYYRSSRSFSMRHSLLPSSVKSALLQHSMCIVFGYYQCIIWGWEGWGTKEGRWIGSFLLKFGAWLGKWRNNRKTKQLMIWFCV